MLAAAAYPNPFAAGLEIQIGGIVLSEARREFTTWLRYSLRMGAGMKESIRVAMRIAVDTLRTSGASGGTLTGLAARAIIASIGHVFMILGVMVYMEED